MNITSWNVNGLRAIATKGAFDAMMKALDPDILLLQETKCTPEQLPEDVRNISGYHSFFDYAKTRAGYSGVALYSKRAPREVRLGMNIPEYDQEGRLITALYDDIAVICGYFPNGGQGPLRLAYKLDFYDAFLDYVNTLARECPVVWGGDINTAHHPIDLARPKENEKNTGFLPEERAWLDEVVAQGWVDTFRHFHPARSGAYTYWDTKTRARERNVGWRIDYLFCSPTLLPCLSRADIHTDIFGSDHCPVSVHIKDK